MYSFIKNLGHFSAETITAKLAFGVALFAIGLTLSMQNTPCISASSCVVGASETFSGTVKINSGNNYGHTLTGTATTDRTLALPDVDGELFVASFTGNANKIMQVNSSANGVNYGFVDPLTQIDITSGGTQTPQAGQVAQINTAANALTFGNVGIQTINDSGLAGQFLKSSGGGLSFSKISITDPTQIDLGVGSAGQILTINQTATALEFGALPASAGSFQAIAAQDVVHGAVGMETNGEVRNITALQDQTTALLLHANGQTATNTGLNTSMVSALYNSNIDGTIITYFDHSKPAGCDTGMFVDVAQETVSGVMSLWGRQCLSNEWGNHSSHYQNNGGFVETGNRDGLKTRRYGQEWDETVNEYVSVYYGGAQNYGQFWAVPFSVDPSNNTLTVGQESLVHDEHSCNNDQACSYYNNTYDISSFIDMVYDTNDNQVMIFWNAIHGSSWQTGYMRNRPFTCTTPMTSSTNCTNVTSWANHDYISGTLTQYTQHWHPEIWFSDNNVSYMVNTSWASNSDQCRIYSFRITGSTGWNASINTTFLQLNNGGGSTYTEIGGTTARNNNTYGTYCSSSKNGSIAYDSVNEVFVVMTNKDSTYQSAWDYNSDIWFIKSPNTVNGTPVLTGAVDLQNRIAASEGVTLGNLCQNMTGYQCNNHVQIKSGNWTFDANTTTFKFYMPSLVDNNQCPNDSYRGTCNRIYEFSMYNANDYMDISTFKSYEYQDPTEAYYNHTGTYADNVLNLIKDSSSGIVYATNYYNNTKTGSETLGHIQAYSIQDNINTLIGLVNQSGTATSTVTVYSVGAVVDGFTGLTIGERYFVDTSGNIATTGDYEIGRAIASDKIYITKAR